VRAAVSARYSSRERSPSQEHAHERADDDLWPSAERLGNRSEYKWPDPEHGQVGERRRLEDVGRHARVLFTEAAARSAVRLRVQGEVSSRRSRGCTLAARRLERSTRDGRFRVGETGLTDALKAEQ